MDSTRRNITFDLMRSDAYELTVYWTEDGADGAPVAEQLILRSTEGRWEPWQVAGVVAAVAAGTPKDAIVAPDDAPPAPTGLARLAQRASQAVLAAADVLTRARNPIGGLR